MIKANELRIGNFIKCDLLDDSYIDRKPYYGKCVYCVSVIFSLSCKIETGHGAVQQLSEIDIQPIPLTEEWLIKFGFEIEKEYWINEYGLKVWHNGKGFYHLNDEILVYIDYIHQLQNFCFATTGRELTLKDKTE